LQPTLVQMLQCKIPLICEVRACLQQKHDRGQHRATFAKIPGQNLPIHSHLPLTLYLASPRVRALFRLFRYSSSFDRPRTFRREAGFCQ
jgi:hypothetical protein